VDFVFYVTVQSVPYTLDGVKREVSVHFIDEYYFTLFKSTLADS
jgi:hypothetical protein